MVFAQELKVGFRVTGSPVAALNAVFEPNGEINGFPLYRAVGGGAPGLYYRTDGMCCLVADYSAEGAQKGLANAIGIATGVVPLGAHSWTGIQRLNSIENRAGHTSEDCVITITAAATDAELQAAVVAVVADVAAAAERRQEMQAAVCRQAVEVRLLYLRCFWLVLEWPPHLKLR